jgi:hypothetical protein
MRGDSFSSDPDSIHHRSHRPVVEDNPPRADPDPRGFVGEETLIDVPNPRGFAGAETVVDVPDPRGFAGAETMIDAPDQGVNPYLPQPASPQRDVAEKTSPEAVTFCPRCKSPLSERISLGWCQRCGYCRSVEEVRGIMPGRERFVLLDFTKGSSLGEWLTVLVCGSLVCVVASFIASWNLAGQPRERAWWFLAQMCVGGFLVAMSHSAAFFKIVPEGKRLRHGILFFSPTLWGAVWKRLPETGWQVWLATWGMTLITCAMLVYLRLVPI